MFWMMINETLNADELNALKKVLRKVQRRTGINGWVFQNTPGTPGSLCKGREHGVQRKDQRLPGSSTESIASSSV